MTKLRGVGIAVTAVLTSSALVMAARHLHEPELVIAQPTVVAAAVPVPPQVPEPVPVGVEPKPSEDLPPLSVAAVEKVDARARALAGELRRRWTKSPEQLVEVIDHASRSAVTSPPVTLLLAIAHAETNGKILDVSEAGAVGLAQATPVAYLQEEFEGKLFVTTDYLVGARAYITKKPLGDAYKIANLAAQRDAASQKRARALLPAAFRLRREGIDELETLRPHATATFFARIEAADRRNLATLRELERLMKRGDRKALRRFADDVRSDYNDLRKLQLESWKRYQKELIEKRDVLLVERFGNGMRHLEEERVYEASEYLAEHLDDRFSARRMAAFLVRHLERKATEARKLAGERDDVEEMTAALYNGGSHNVKRMIAGLIGSLPETQKYMKKVPETRRVLDASAEAAVAAGRAGSEVVGER